MTLAAVGMEASLAQAISALVAQMHVGLSPVGFAADGGLEYNTQYVQVEAPPPLLSPRYYAHFVNGGGHLVRSPALKAMFNAIPESGEAGDRFRDMFEDTQAAVIVEGVLHMNGRGRLIGHVGQVISDYGWRDAYAVKALVAEHEASVNGGRKGRGPFHAADMWLQYAIYSDLRGPLRRHVFSRAIWHAAASGEAGFQARAHTLSGYDYLGQAAPDVEEGILEMLRAAALEVRGNASLSEVRNRLKEATGHWRDLLGDGVEQHDFYHQAVSIARRVAGARAVGGHA